MQKFRRLFVLLFILSIFVGVVHEASHNHYNGEMCEVCVLAHSPGLLNDASDLLFIEAYYTAFIVPSIAYPDLHTLQARSRSPPIS